jgi:hypothetical protein
MRRGGLILVVYLLIGVIVALTQGYFEGLGNITDILEAVVAVLIWPLVLIGVDVNFSGGGNGGGGGGNGGGPGS